MARLKPREAAVQLRTRLMGEPRRRQLIALATAAIDEASAVNRRAIGREVDHQVIVDGRRGAPVSSVKPGGVVVALFAVHAAAVDFTWETLARLSPVDESPNADDVVYRENHRLLINGEEALPPVEIRVDDEVTFVNLLPYARRIERGHSKRQAPDGVYEVTSQIVKARFGNIVTVKFGYGSFLGAPAVRDTRFPYISLLPKRRR